MENKIELLKELVRDWQENKIKATSAMIVVASIVDPQKVTKKGIEWAHGKLKKEEQNNEKTS